ncbi:hypothetical protein AGMMS49545_08840 [Betaproteobacteria bacterium]|nr:hypothetical protein AGMMS49545_08840 [Betaproteobacteria bacterium]GHU43920.1 hypothetical protein AGMMS50289_11180 [Betaproteobacteria bacterium]
MREKARGRLASEILPLFDSAFPVSKGWFVVAVSGRRSGVITEIAKALNEAAGFEVVDPRKVDGQSLISALIKTSESGMSDGLLLLIDEMGKFLEVSACGGDDVHFFQDLAERSARSKAPFLVVGILHQAFRQYAAHLGTESRDDWAKVQGRFVDIPLVASSDEVVELLAKAVKTDLSHKWTMPFAEQVANSIRGRKPTVGKSFRASLDACWPLHPTMAALLGPISKRQFGQNERSIFGFLSSLEPYGFTTFFENVDSKTKTWYRPNDYWDFLRANLEPAILASPDGHRWAQAVDAVERVETKGDPLRITLVKNIAIIDLFRNGSGLTADTQVIGSLFPDITQNEIEQALSDLVSWRTAIFRKHTGSWAVFEGSDFDIDAAVSKAQAEGVNIELVELSEMAMLHPVVAKRHYYDTGTLRWMDVGFADMASLEALISDDASTGGFGRFLLYLPARDETQEKAKRKIKKFSEKCNRTTLLGVTSNHGRILELGTEFAALRHVSTKHHELVGDSVARREIAARLATVRSALEDEIRGAMDIASWLIESEWVKGTKLSPLASNLADFVFYSAPRIFSELVNRDSLSPNAVKARKDLLHRMLIAEDEENLGLEGWPAERGLHETILRTTGLHTQAADNAWCFHPPSQNDTERFAPLWRATDALFGDGIECIEVEDIYTHWYDEPFGLRKGCAPILLAAYILSRKESLAIYKDGMFIPRMTDADMDECLQDEKRFSLKKVSANEEKAEILSGIAEILQKAGRDRSLSNPLDAARGLVGLVFSLPEWVRRTHTLSTEAIALRDILLRAKDPHKVLFVDIPATLGVSAVTNYLSVLEPPLLELAGAYSGMIRSMESRMLKELDAISDDVKGLRHRASTVEGLSGDFRLNAFASRLVEYDGSVSSMEGILSLAANKPPRLWSDSDIDAAHLELASWALRFRQIEALAAVKGREPTREAFAIVVGASTAAKTVIRSFDVPERDKNTVEELSAFIIKGLSSSGLRQELLLAALAKAGLTIAAEEITNP